MSSQVEGAFEVSGGKSLYTKSFIVRTTFFSFYSHFNFLSTDSLKLDFMFWASDRLITHFWYMYRTHAGIYRTQDLEAYQIKDLY